MKKVQIILYFLLTAFVISGCASQNDKIYLFSREEGSGTREQFVKELNIYNDGYDGIDTDASVSNSSAVILSAVKDGKNAIGYISFAAVNEKVKAISVDGIAPTDKNMQSGAYPLMRDFSLVYYPDSDNETAADFIEFLTSRNAENAIRDMGYLPVGKAGEYSGQKVLKGKTVIAGSASVAPLMERLRTEYAKYQPDVEIEIQQNDSSTGLSLIQQKIVDVAMSSRDVKSGEIKPGYQMLTIAKDGIAVIVHPENKVQGLTSEQIKDVFSGKIKKWSELENA